MFADQCVESVLADVSEGRVAQVVCEAGCFDNLGVKTPKACFVRLFLLQLLSQSTADLRNLDRVLLARVKHVRFPGADDLRNSSESMKRRGVENAITVPLKL